MRLKLESLAKILMFSAKRSGRAVFGMRLHPRLEPSEHCSPRHRCRSTQTTRVRGELDEVAGGICQALPARVTRYDREIDMGDRYGRSIWEIGLQ